MTNDVTTVPNGLSLVADEAVVSTVRRVCVGVGLYCTDCCMSCVCVCQCTPCREGCNWMNKIMQRFGKSLSY